MLVRRRLSGLHGPPARARRRRQDARPPAARGAPAGTPGGCGRANRCGGAVDGRDRGGAAGPVGDRMTVVGPTPATLIERRLAAFRRERSSSTVETGRPVRSGASELATRLAAALDADVVESRLGTIVRRDVGAVPVPIDRTRLASLPGQAPADVPLVCLDTETTGLATAAGTMAFLVGLGRWDGTQFRVTSCSCPTTPRSARSWRPWRPRSRPTPGS